MRSRVFSHSEAEIVPLFWGPPKESNARPMFRPPAVKEPETVQAEQDPGELNQRLQQQLKQAYEAGFREGESKARAAGEGEVRATVERLVASMGSLAEARNEAIRGAEADIVRLSIEIARRILHREISLDSSAVEALIKAALTKLRSEDLQRVRIHPDLEHVMRVCLKQMGRSADIEVIADATQPRGSALFEISRGTLDASIDTQLDEIERGLADRLLER